MAKKSKEPTKDVKVEKFTQSHKVSLTREEVEDRADRAAQKLAERDAKDEEQKAAAKHAKSIIESLTAELRRLSNEVRTRSTYSSVECERVLDYTEGTVTERRLDTGEQFSERPMTDAEKQREIPFEAPHLHDGDDRA